jgi:hypothetical protein
LEAFENPIFAKMWSLTGEQLSIKFNLMRSVLYLVCICSLAGCDSGSTNPASKQGNPDPDTEVGLTIYDSKPRQELSEVVYPSLPSHVSVAGDFVVDGWKLIAVKEGDLNRDGKSDIVALMRMTDPANVRPVPDPPYYNSDDTNPFLLAIGLAEQDGFALTATHHALFPREVAPMHGENPPDDGSFEIKDGVLTLILGHLRGSEQVRFRWNGHDFALIGYDCSGAMNGDSVSLSANYLTRKARYERITSSGENRTVSTVRIRPGKRPNIEQIDSVFGWTGTDDDGATLAC